MIVKICEGCDNEFSYKISVHRGGSHNRKFCTESCRLAAVREAYVPKPLVSFTCDQCHIEFTAKSNGKNRFCSRKCKQANRVERSHYVDFCVTCDQPMIATTAGHADHRTRFCSRVCFGVSRRIDPERLAAKNHAARAFRFGVEYDRTVTRAAVLDRDGWICGLCSEPIPKDADYPSYGYGSLDHIKPLSKGGAHVWSNVQAAHLGCNIAKGAAVDVSIAELEAA